MRRLLVMSLFLACAPAGADDAPAPAFFTALRAADLRVAAIGYRLTTANVALCRDHQPQLGVALQALDQFAPAARAAADRAFGFQAAVAVEAVVPGAPADRAGLTTGDSLVAIDGAVLPAKAALAVTGTAETRRAAEDRVALAKGPVRLTVHRGGIDRVVTVEPVAGCRARIEMILDTGWDADADGATIRVGSRFLERFGDAEVAVIMAHELAHVILRHRARLDSAKVDRGLLAEVGRNGRLFRQTEDEADRLSVYLLYNAGYDPASPARFWAGPGVKLDGGIFRSRTHRGAGGRTTLVAVEAQAIAPDAPRPIVPAMLALRDAALR